MTRQDTQMLGVYRKRLAEKALPFDPERQEHVCTFCGHPQIPQMRLLESCKEIAEAGFDVPACSPCASLFFYGGMHLRTLRLLQSIAFQMTPFTADPSKEN